MATAHVTGGFADDLGARIPEAGEDPFPRRIKSRADERDIRALGLHVGFSSGGRSPPETPA